MATTFDLVNTGRGGKLADELLAYRTQGLTIDQITAQLSLDGYDVSRETVRRWLLRINGAAS